MAPLNLHCDGSLLCGSSSETCSIPVSPVSPGAAQTASAVLPGSAYPESGELHSKADLPGKWKSLPMKNFRFLTQKVPPKLRFFFCRKGFPENSILGGPPAPPRPKKNMKFFILLAASLEDASQFPTRFLGRLLEAVCSGFSSSCL